MSRADLKPIQAAILEYIKNEYLSKGYPPSVREICDAVGLKSTSSVHAHLATLEKKGYIRRDSFKTRAIEIIDDDFGISRREMVSIPVLGQVAAGVPILAEQNIEDYFPLPADMLSSGDHFMLRVKGDSMVNIGLLSGATVICRIQQSANNGEIVVALVDDSATVKRLYKEKGHFRLQPENDDMEPIIVDDCKILGIVEGMLRFYGRQ
jgi:repressor LexA